MATVNRYLGNPKYEKLLWLVIALMVLLLLVTSCSTTRRANRATKKLKKLELKYADVWDQVSKETVRIDTVIERIEVPGETQVRVELDSAQKDSLESMIRELQIEADKDPIIRKITEYVTKNIEIDPVDVDTLDLHLKIWYDSPARTLEYSLTRDETHIIAEKEVDVIKPIQYITVYKTPWYIWLLLLVFTILSGALVFKNRRDG